MKIAALAFLASAAAAVPAVLAAPSGRSAQVGSQPRSGPQPMDVTRKITQLLTSRASAQPPAVMLEERAHAKNNHTKSAIPTNFNNPSLKTNPKANAKGPALPDGVEPSAGCSKCASSLKFKGAKAKSYQVGNQIPTLPFKTKTSWAGNIEITGKTISDKPSLFFWLWGKDDTKASDDLVIWLNGGPGCSSLGGMLQENGPFLYESVKEKPFANPYSWTKEANILYVEQPVGTGFTTGKTKNTDEQQVAAQFSSFLDGFFKDFPELKGKNLYITGESYAGTYIPHIMNYLYTHGNKFNLKSGIIVDGTITADATQSDLVVYDYVLAYKDTLKFNDSDVARVKKESDECGLTDYASKYLKYPPVDGKKLPDFNRTECNAWYTFYEIANGHNPQFNIYNIDIPDPSTLSPLGNPNGGAAAYKIPTFFDNKDIQKYINAPSKKWVECALKVFVGEEGDTSPPPDQDPSFKNNILADVIEAGASDFIIMQGQLDALIITNGTSISLQNLTWNGAQGFSQSPFTQKLIDTDGQQSGTFTAERGLQYAIVDKSGHMIPGDTPSTGLASLQVLLGDRTFSA